MRIYLFIIVLCLFSCKRIDLDESKGSQTALKSKSFNLKKLKSFVQKRSDFENKFANGGLKKLASTSTMPSIDYNDFLLWEYAIKEIISEENYSYNVPVKDSFMKDKIENYLPEKGYSVLNLYTDSTYDNVYARLREYRPTPSYIDSICQFKGITMANHNYLDYHEVLEGEKFDGYIVVYNLDNSPFKLIQVKKGLVTNVIMYNKNI